MCGFASIKLGYKALRVSFPALGVWAEPPFTTSSLLSLRFFVSGPALLDVAGGG